MRDAYYIVSAIFIVVSIVALWQQRQTNVLLNDILIALQKK
jgi:hypothetical protein